MSKEFAIYKGDKFEFIGTVEEICKEYGVRPATVWFWSSKANLRRIENSKRDKKGKSQRRISVAIDYKEEEDECFI